MPGLGVVFDNEGFHIGISNDGTIKEELKHLEHKMFVFEANREGIETAINEAKEYLRSKNYSQSEIDDAFTRFSRVLYFHVLCRQD